MKDKNMKNNDKTDMVFGPKLYADHLRAFLGADQYVTVDCDDRKKLINVIVTGCPFKADCLASILITEDDLRDTDNGKKYNLDGYKIAVNGNTDHYKMKVTQKVISSALAGNEYFKGIEKHTIKAHGASVSRWFGMLKPIVVQAPVDNFGNPYGMDSFTAEEFTRYAFNKKAKKCVAWTTDRK